MIKLLKIKNFTTFSNAQIEFSPGLNVIIGDNATGKSHLVKLAYSIIHTLYKHENSQLSLQQQIADKLQNVLKPRSLGHLSRNGSGRTRTEIELELADDSQKLQFSFAKNSRREVRIDKRITSVLLKTPLFFPTSEVLTLASELPALYEERYISIDETHYDLCKALNLPLLKKVSKDLKDIITPLEAELGGTIIVDKSGDFYLDIPKQGKVEISLIAEGLRKIAMLVYLIQNGSLTKGSTLFWDEVETNLNSRIMVKVANALARIAQNGIQVIVTTHDFFLMKELSLLIESTPKMLANFFSLKANKDGVVIEQGRLLEDLHTIVVLDEVLTQDDREQDFYYKSGR